MEDIQELVKKLEGQGCPNCKAKIDLADHVLIGARLTNEEEPTASSSASNPVVRKLDALVRLPSSPPELGCARSVSGNLLYVLVHSVYGDTQSLRDLPVGEPSLATGDWQSLAVAFILGGRSLRSVLKAYEENHLPGAISLPLRRIDREAAAFLDRSRAVIVYCWDVSGDMSPRAAWRLETLGFAQVFDYADGKLDWMAAGLATEGTNATKPRAGDLARKDTPTCHLTEHLAEVRDRVRGLGWDAVAVWRQAIVVLACIVFGAGLGLVPALVTKGPIDYLAVGGQNSIRHDRRSSVNA